MEHISLLQIWPWLGTPVSFMLLFLLFGTKVFQANKDISRWRDAQWIGWLAVAVIMLHVTEEYGCTVLGQTYAFPETMLGVLSGVLGYSVTLPPEMFPVVNLTIAFFGIPAVALLANKHPFVLTSTMGLFALNGMSHLMPSIATGQLNPGVFTGAFLLIPLSIWYFYAFFARGKMRVRWGWFIIINGIIVMGILSAAIISYVTVGIPVAALMFLHCLNAAFLPIVPLLEEKLIGRRRLYKANS